MSVADAIENHMKDMEDRKGMREETTIRIAIFAVLALLLGTVLTIGLTTHRSNMLELSKSERLNQQCLSQGWNPLWCRKMTDYDWYHPHQYTKSKPNVKKKVDK